MHLLGTSSLAPTSSNIQYPSSWLSCLRPRSCLYWQVFWPVLSPFHDHSQIRWLVSTLLVKKVLVYTSTHQFETKGKLLAIFPVLFFFLIICNGTEWGSQLTKSLASWEQTHTDLANLKVIILANQGDYKRPNSSLIRSFLYEASISTVWVPAQGPQWPNQPPFVGGLEFPTTTTGPMWSWQDAPSQSV